MKCNWIYFPNNQRPPKKLLDITEAFDSAMPQIASPGNTLESNSVLDCVANDLQKAGFKVEKGKKS